MNYRELPAPVLAKLLSLEEVVEDLTQRVTKTHTGITSARTRLTAGFRNRTEGDDLNASLKQLISDAPVLEQKLHDAQRTLSACKAWLDSLPEGTTLEPVTVDVNGRDLPSVRAKIKTLEAELAALRAAPSADVRQRVEDYVHSMARPTITGLGKGERIKVVWPGAGFDTRGPREDRAEVLSLMALLFPDAMVAALMGEIETHSSDVCPSVLTDEIERLAFLEEILVTNAIADGKDVQRRTSAPPQAALGVRIAEATKTSRAA
jgi:hypothetical protein